MLSPKKKNFAAKAPNSLKSWAMTLAKAAKSVKKKDAYSSKPKSNAEDGVVVKEKVKYHSGKAMARKQRRADRRARRN